MFKNFKRYDAVEFSILKREMISIIEYVYVTIKMVVARLFDIDANVTANISEQLSVWLRTAAEVKEVTCESRRFFADRLKKSGAAKICGVV